MYPKNAASPEPIAIGAVVQISDGAVQTSGCTVRIKPIGVAEGDGAGTTAYSTDGIVLYTPTQGETNYTSFILIAKKTGCIPVSITVVTSASSTPGTVEHAGTIKTLDALDTAQDTQHGTTQTAIADVPTVSEFNARTLAAADYFDPAADTVANVTTVATVTNLTNLPAITANWLTAAGLAADAVTEIQSGLATAANLATVAGYLDTEIAAILADTDELQTNQGNWLTATGFSTHSAADVWAVATRVLTAGTNIVLAKGTGVTGFNDIAATDIVSAGAITTLSGAVVNVDLVDTCTTNTDMRGTDSAYTGMPPTVGQIADQVWDEAIAGHAGAGSTGEALSAAGSAGDPWSTALPGAYGAGTAGKIIGDNIDAAITSRMASYTQPTGFLAATFPSAVGDATAANQTTIAGYIDTEVSAILSGLTSGIVVLHSDYNSAKTASQAGDAMALTSGERTTLAAAIWNALTSGMSTVGSIGKKLADVVFDWNTTTPPTAAAVASQVRTELTTELGRIDAAVSSRSSHTAANVLSALGTGTWATAIPWNTAWDTEVQSEVQDAIVANHLDHLLAVDYDPASKPGVSTALLNELIGNDAGVSQFTAKALELGPSGSGLTAQQTRDAMKLAPSAGAAVSGSIDDQLAGIPAALFTNDSGETYASAVAGSPVKEIADNAGVGAITNLVTISASAPSLTAINSGGTITIHRGDLTSFQLTDLGSLAGRTGEKIYFTVKAAEYTTASVDDTVATIQVTETTGATRLNGETTTASYGSITVDDATGGDITIALQHQLTTALPIANGYYWDVQLINSAGKPVTLTRGLVNVDADVTRSTT